MASLRSHRPHAGLLVSGLRPTACRPTPVFVGAFFHRDALKNGGIGYADCMPLAFFWASPYGLAAYPGFCRGFFSSRCAEKMAASATPIVCRHRPSAAESFQVWWGFALLCAAIASWQPIRSRRWRLSSASSSSLPPGTAELRLGPCGSFFFNPARHRPGECAHRWQIIKQKAACGEQGIVGQAGVFALFRHGAVDA